MGKNNEMYKSFKRMVDGYKQNDVDGVAMFELGVLGWLTQDPENPFEKNTEAHNLFFRMKLYYNNSNSNTPGSKFSKKQILVAARKLCELKPKNPYKFDKKEEAEDEIARKEKIEAQKKLEQEKKELEIKKEAERIIKEEQRQKQAELRKQIEKAEFEAKKIEAAERQMKIEKLVADERERISHEQLPEEIQLADLLKKNEEEKARIENIGKFDVDISQTRSNTAAETTQELAEPQVVLGVLPEDKPRKGFFKRLFHRE